MNILNSHVLVLNQSFQPMSITNVKKAFLLIYLGKAEIVEKNCEFIRSVNDKFPLPSIVRLTRYIHVPRKQIMLTRKNIIKRDGHQCQYCGKRTIPLTIDHVIPRVRGGKDTWENLVCACIKCNNKKGDRSPEQASMKLMRPPKRPNHIFFIRYSAGTIDHRWKPYLYMN
ncbi:HNH endonuclease [candidate division KSB1 bacterium 4572_119]|nr:MAG: HNH endonuclease [candidate division KSB1 bacterium 4572_119]